MHYTQPNVYEFISKQTDDPIVERKTCAISGTKFPIYQSDLDFYAKVSPTFAGEVFALPSPDVCREERTRRRYAWRNLIKLYRRKCSASNKDIISIYHPDAPYVVYDQTIRWSDQYDPLEYGMDFDFSKTFTENFKALQLRVPRCSLLNGMNENADYANHSYHNKNSYLVFASGFCEDCLFNDRVINSQQVVDSWNMSLSNNCYECLASKSCANCFWVSYSENCTDVRYASDCKNCSFCIGCINLQNKQYHVFNREVTQEEFEKIATKMQHDISYRNNLVEQYYTLKNTSPHSARKSTESYHSFCIESTHTKDSKFVVEGKELENVSYCSELMKAKDCRDVNVRGIGDRLYECHCVGGNLEDGSAGYMYNVMFSNVIRHGNDMYYCDNCLGEAKHCFGCVGLKNQSYCIFNKQYTKEAYDKQVAKIIHHMQSTGERGKYFDNSLSPFRYDETMAMVHYPETQETCEQLGFTRKGGESDIAIGDINAVIHPGTYTDEARSCLIDEEDIVHKIILCAVSGRPFRLTKQEIAFYKRHNLSLPKKHPDTRYSERIRKRPGMHFSLRTCDKTGEEMISVYDSEVAFPVWSEEAWQQKIYG